MAVFTFFVSGEPLQGSWELLADIHAETCGVVSLTFLVLF